MLSTYYELSPVLRAGFSSCWIFLADFLQLQTNISISFLFPRIDSSSLTFNKSLVLTEKKKKKNGPVFSGLKQPPFNFLTMLWVHLPGPSYESLSLLPVPSAGLVRWIQSGLEDPGGWGLILLLVLHLPGPLSPRNFQPSDHHTLHMVSYHNNQDYLYGGYDSKKAKAESAKPLKAQAQKCSIEPLSPSSNQSYSR